jgi:TolB-like protein
VREIGQALGATVLLEGTVHVDAGAVRLEVRLVDVAAGRKLWVDDFVSVSGDLDRLELDASAAAASYLRTRYRR